MTEAKRQTTEELLARVAELEEQKTPVCWIPEGAGSEGFVDGHGYRVAIVIAGDDGYHWTGDWPYVAEKGHRMPWFYGPDLEVARRLVDEQNAAAGITRGEAAMVVLRSMARSTGGHPPQLRRADELR